MTHRRWGPLVVAVAGGTMLALSWGTWPDCIVDFGRELYVPWQITQGKALYHDIVSYFNGPLSPYLHAALFRIFGVSLQTLVWFNLVAVTALATLLYCLLARAWGVLAATAGGVSFFVLFAFAQYGVAGNYNFVCPYSYELPHGITLSAAAIYCMARWHEARRSLWLAATGALLGLIFLTKAEVFLAAAVALLFGVAGSAWIHRRNRRQIAADLAGFLGYAAAVVLIAFFLLLTVLQPGEAARGLAGSWRWLGDRELLQLPFFQELAGTRDITASLRTIGLWAAAYTLLFGLPAVIGLKWKPSRPIAGCVFVGLLAGGLWLSPGIDWPNFIRPVPIALVVTTIVMLMGIARRKSGDLLAGVLLIWSLALLAKMPFNAHINHYGFALAMPATLVSVALLIGWLPRLLDQHGGSGMLLRSAAWAAMIVMLIAHARREIGYWHDKTVVVGEGADAFYADDRGAIVQQALLQLRLIATPDATLVVVPEGLIVNYLARRTNPTGQLNFTPPAIMMYGEDEMLRVFREHPPDFLLVTGVDTAEYGARFFGDDYARQLGAWMRTNYVAVQSVGPQPFRDPGFGVILLRRRG